MDYPKFRQTLLNRLKRVHPDVNSSPNAAGQTRFLIGLLKLLPVMQAQKGLTRQQWNGLLKELR